MRFAIAAAAAALFASTANAQFSISIGGYPYPSRVYNSGYYNPYGYGNAYSRGYYYNPYSYGNYYNYRYRYNYPSYYHNTYTNSYYRPGVMRRWWRR